MNSIHLLHLTGPLSYSGFAQMVDLQTVSSWSQVARVFHIAAHLNQSLGTEEMTETIKHLALRYIRENCETWVAQKGGFVSHYSWFKLHVIIS